MKRIAFLVIPLALSALARADEDLIGKYNRQIEEIRRNAQLGENVPANQRILLDYGAYVSLNYINLSDNTPTSHGLREMDLTGYARYNLDNIHEIFVRGRMSYLDFDPGDSFDGKGDKWQFILERAYYRFDLQQYLSHHGSATQNDLAVQVGRQYAYWANGLALSQTFDGALFDITYGPFNVELLAGETPHHDTVDFDSSRPQFDDNTRRGFFGAMATANIGSQHPFGYLLIQRDYNLDYVATNGPFITHFEYNSWYLGLGSAGAITDKLSYGVEAVYEGGRGLSNSFEEIGTSLSSVPQQHDDIGAYALDARLDYFFNDPRKSHLTGEFLLASGDHDRSHTSNTFAGNQPGTEDNAYNGFGLLNTGLAFTPNVSNLLMLHAGASTFPLAGKARFDKLQMGADLFLYGKYETHAPIDEATTNSRYLGFEPDIFANWQVTEDVTVAVRYGLFFPGTAIAGSHDPRHSLFIGVTYAF